MTLEEIKVHPVYGPAYAKLGEEIRLADEAVDKLIKILDRPGHMDDTDTDGVKIADKAYAAEKVAHALRDKVLELYKKPVEVLYNCPYKMGPCKGCPWCEYSGKRW